MRPRVFFCAFALLTPLFAQAAPPAARLLTVDLFSARALHTITLTPAGSNSWMRACPACPKQAVTVPIQITLEDGALRTNAIQARAAALRFQGAFRARADGAPEEIAASGLWEVKGFGRSDHFDHGLHLLLTMPSERYVALALNGEAAPDEPLESLKAMAIVMRTYALTNASRHAASGFNLCDSTHCQALGYGRVRPEIEGAVLDTSGETLWHGPRRAEVFYTQNCGGQTEDAGSVWPDLREPYLRSHADPYCLRGSSSQWQAEIPESRIQAIGRRQGWRIPPRIERVRVVRSTSSGRASLIEMEGAGDRVLISAGSLRFAIDRALGWNKLRSDWYTVELSNGVLRFAGRGYGHGVGLCQAGAYEMALAGKSAGDILGFYFPGTQVRIGVPISPADHGWQNLDGKGWTLMTATPAPALLRAGNAAWSQAQALFPPRSPAHPPIHPVVRLMPTTELFRQATSEPGWILASTRGEAVFLQPGAVLARNGGASATLLHEFLHVLVEEEAGSGAPLWLREGLVEALASPRRGGPRTTLASLDAADLEAADLETALGRPRDQAQSQRAHTVSGALVTDLMARFGVSAVRGWLIAGVPKSVLRSPLEP